MKAGILQLIAVLALAIGVPAQSFNIDLGTAAGSGAGAPSSTFGGAAARPGMWNDIVGTTTGPFPLMDLGGVATAVTLTLSSSSGLGFSFNNANTTGDFELLLDDGQDVGGVGSMRVYMVSGLAAGTYVVTTYAVAPDSATFITNVSVTGSTSMNPQASGGTVPMNAFMVGVTHTVHVVNVTSGAMLTITAATGSGFGTVNGFQICNDYTFSLSQPSGPGGDLVISNTCGEPGNFFVNLATGFMGSFPNGPLFGLDMTLQQGLDLINAGPPFLGTLDANGQFNLTLPGPIPSGITLYLVGLQVSPMGTLVSQLAPFSYTTL